MNDRETTFSLGQLAQIIATITVALPKALVGFSRKDTMRLINGRNGERIERALRRMFTSLLIEISREPAVAWTKPYRVIHTIRIDDRTRCHVVAPFVDGENRVTLDTARARARLVGRPMTPGEFKQLHDRANTPNGDGSGLWLDDVVNNQQLYAELTEPLERHEQGQKENKAPGLSILWRVNRTGESRWSRDIAQDSAVLFRAVDLIICVAE